MAIVAAAKIAAVPHRSTAAYLFSAAVYDSSSLLCHQRPERSFHPWGVQFPVCARCAGIYAGAAIGAILAMVRPNVTRRLTPAVTSSGVLVRLEPDSTGAVVSGFSRSSRRVVHVTSLFAASLPAALTLVYEWTTGVMPANWIRALSGLVLGATAAIVVMRAGAVPAREVN